MSLCESVSGRLRDDGVKCRTVTLKIRLEGFKTYTRSLTLVQATNFADTLYKEVKALYNNFDRAGKRVRLVGVKASNMACEDDKTLLVKITTRSRRAFMRPSTR
jgi:DNA polymerase-4